MAKNLVEDVGLNYFRDRWPYCMFYGPNGEVCYLNHDVSWGGDGNIPTIIVNDDGKEINTRIPYEFFSSLAVFKTPPLGWREAEDGKLMGYFRRANFKNYKKALSVKYLHVWWAPITMLFQELGENQPTLVGSKKNTGALTKMVMKPAFTPLHRGMAELRQGSRFGFALSPNMAIMAVDNDRFGLYWNTTMVGEIDDSNRAVCSSKSLSRLLEIKLNELGS